MEYGINSRESWNPKNEIGLIGYIFLCIINLQTARKSYKIKLIFLEK